MLVRHDGNLDFPRNTAKFQCMSEEDLEPQSNLDLARLFRDTRGKVLGWIRRRVADPAEAEDLLQDTFLRITQRSAPETVEHFEGYLFRTAESVLADRHRRRTVRRADAHVELLGTEDYRDEDADALRALIAKEKLKSVATALMTLPERTRTVFVLRRIEGLRYGEIATRLKVSLSTVEKEMARAVSLLLIEGVAP